MGPVQGEIRAMSEITFAVKRVVVVQGSGSDKIAVFTDLPGPIWPFEEKAVLSIEAAAGTGPEYVRAVFGVEPEVIHRG
uniref:Uncharacterized protein n=4 Tax=root TaxID=1 RepID=A0A8S5UIQ4_9CAUD|nr:MAG TPA: hypothetical protein [Myoviridae sp. ctu2j3]DAF94385.1 MAG TPA: hypothetical protein [Myoviridae sp. ctu2j3]